MSAQAQKFEIFEKSSLWVSVVRGLKAGNEGEVKLSALALRLVIATKMGPKPF